jgi:proteasome lid subunit RPN8/RPN11
VTIRTAAIASAPAVTATSGFVQIASKKTKGVQPVMKNNSKHSKPRPAKLRFSPTAWAKLLCLRDAGETEVCGFGITGAGDLLFVEDIVLVDQVCTWVTADLDDGSVADFFDAQVDEGRKPEQFARIFIHTHPGSSPQPSSTDEETFARVFGGSEWAVMFIVARKGECFARLRYNVGPGLDAELQVEVDYRQPFGPSEEDLWYEEYESNVRELEPAIEVHQKETKPVRDGIVDDSWPDAWLEYADFDMSERRHQYDF